MKTVQFFNFQDHEDAEDPQHYCLVQMMRPGQMALIGNMYRDIMLPTQQNIQYIRAWLKYSPDWTPPQSNPANH